MTDIPEDVQPYVAQGEGVDEDGEYWAEAEVGDEFAEGAEEESNV